MLAALRQHLPLKRERKHLGSRILLLVPQWSRRKMETHLQASIVAVPLAEGPAILDVRSCAKATTVARKWFQSYCSWQVN